jgi:2-hydroxycyclohexanecarboxyl-CoA dehydrogenase
MGEARFAGQTAVVTGGGCGLGLEIGRYFGREGAYVVLAEIDHEKGEAAAEALRGEGLEAEFAALDVRRPEQSLALVEQLVDQRGHIDVWVNNAGVAHKGPAEDLPREHWDESVAVMLSGAFYCAQAVSRPMLARQRGTIVNMASVNGYLAIEGRVAYSAAKAGLIMLTQALGIEWANRGVRVVGLAPGVVLTEMVEKGLAEGTASLETYERRTPMRRLGTPQEIAEAVLYLASDEASYIVGEVLRVDGGWGAYQLF